MQRSPLHRFVAIASRDVDKAREAAARLGIPRAHGSYEALLDDPEVEAVYIPLPNHLHVSWAIRAMEAGKHVLCEKPIALTAAEAEPLIAARDRTGRVIQEAFMFRHHPQWRRVRTLVREGRIGRVQAVAAHFSYTHLDPDNIRNRKDVGGGGLYDLGSYCVSAMRLLFEAEPVRVACLLERDPDFGTDRLTTGVLQFPNGQGTFVIATQAARGQGVRIFGSEGCIDLEMPFTWPAGAPARIRVAGAAPAPPGDPGVPESIAGATHYQLQGDDFARVVLGTAPQEFPIEGAIANMRAIDALFRAAASGRFETV